MDPFGVRCGGGEENPDVPLEKVLAVPDAVHPRLLCEDGVPDGVLGGAMAAVEGEAKLECHVEVTRRPELIKAFTRRELREDLDLSSPNLFFTSLNS